MSEWVCVGCGKSYDDPSVLCDCGKVRRIESLPITANEIRTNLASFSPPHPVTYVQFEDKDGKLTNAWIEQLEERVAELEAFARNVGTVLVRDGHAGGGGTEDCPFCELTRQLSSLEIVFGP